MKLKIKSTIYDDMMMKIVTPIDKETKKYIEKAFENLYDCYVKIDGEWLITFGLDDAIKIAEFVDSLKKHRKQTKEILLWFYYELDTSLDHAMKEIQNGHVRVYKESLEEFGLRMAKVYKPNIDLSNPLDIQIYAETVLGSSEWAELDCGLVVHR